MSSTKPSSAPEELPPVDDILAGLTNDQHKAAQEKYGLNEILVPSTPLWMLFLHQFIGFLPLLIELAAVISISVGDWIDFLIIMAMLFVNAILGFHEEYKAKKSLDELSKELESEIACRRNGETLNVNVKDLVPGDIVLLVGGTIVPADIKWIKGDTVQVDTAAMTGEPIPRKYPSEEYGDIILSGTTVVAGECYGQVTETGENTEIGKAQADILKDKTVMVVSVFQKKIMTVVQALVSMSLLIVVAVLLVSGFVYGEFENDVQKTILDSLSILIASIPIALPLVLQVNLALGASYLAKHYHAIVTSIPALQDIASMSILCSDKTGTLTTANMSIINNSIYAAEGFTQEEVIKYGFLCSNADKKDDPIDKAIVSAFNDTGYSHEDWEQTEIIGFNPSVKRVVSFVKHRPSGNMYTIAKGLPSKILDTAAGALDNHELQWKCEKIDHKDFIEQIKKIDTELSSSGYKTIAIAVCEGNARDLGDSSVWKFAGLLPMLDPPRHDTPDTIESLHHANISVKMITGDHANVGRETARLIGLGTNIIPGEEMRNAQTEAKNSIIWEADGFAAVLPSDKREVVLTLRNHFGLVTGMTGDGVNDAPALSAAQVGIAVDGATDAAKNAADLILTEPGLSPIYGAVLESRRIFSRIKAYVIYRVAASIVLVLSLSIIIFVTGCAVDSLYIIILALLNDVSMIPVAYDNAKATTKPQLPKARSLVTQSLFYGVMNAFLTLMFIFTMDYDKNLFQEIDLNQCSGTTTAFIWLQLTFATELMIFSVRAPGFFLFSMPSWKLIISVIGTCGIGVIISMLSPAFKLSGQNVGWIVLFNVASLIVVDILKIQFRVLIHEEPGTTIDSDELLQAPKLTATEKKVKKDLRYVVHNESIVSKEDMAHVIEVKRRRSKSSLAGFFDIGTEFVLNDGFIQSPVGRKNIGSPLATISENVRVKQKSSPY